MDAPTTVIDTFRDMGDRPVSIGVRLGMILVNDGTIRINAAEDVDRLIAALQKARDFARGRTLEDVVAQDLRGAYCDIGKAIERASNGSALHGLQVVAFAFAAVLDTYALPNSNSPQGMSDDPAAFRRYFAEIVAHGADSEVN